MLEFDNVSKSFWTGTQRKVILDKVSFRVELGRSLGILAPNGTGKTTLINMMAGLEKPDEGEIRRGCRISFPLGFMGGVVGKISAMENSRYIARLYGLDPDYIEAFCRWMCGLGEYFDQPLGTYSSGMKARFTFALMLALDFDTAIPGHGGIMNRRDILNFRNQMESVRQRMAELIRAGVSADGASEQIKDPGLSWTQAEDGLFMRRSVPGFYAEIAAELE